MTALRQVFVGVMLAVALGPAAAFAHSLESLQEQLNATEKYFELKSVPAPDFTLKDAAGAPVSLTDFRGKVVVLHFIFASCPDVCPLHADRIARVQEMINVTPMRDRVEFVTITTDPARDTPDVLKAYGPLHGLDPVNWKFLTSGPDRPEDTRKLAAEFGHTFTPTDDGLQLHSVVTHVIDRDGVLRANFHGLGFEPTNLVLFVNGLVNAGIPHQEPPPPSMWERFRSML